MEIIQRRRDLRPYGVQNLYTLLPSLFVVLLWASYTLLHLCPDLGLVMNAGFIFSQNTEQRQIQVFPKRSPKHTRFRDAEEVTQWTSFLMLLAKSILFWWPGPCYPHRSLPAALCFLPSLLMLISLINSRPPASQQGRRLHYPLPFFLQCPAPLFLKQTYSEYFWVQMALGTHGLNSFRWHHAICDLNIYDPCWVDLFGCPNHPPTHPNPPHAPSPSHIPYPCPPTHSISLFCSLLFFSFFVFVCFVYSEFKSLLWIKSGFSHYEFKKKKLVSLLSSNLGLT